MKNLKDIPTNIIFKNIIKSDNQTVDVLFKKKMGKLRYLKVKKLTFQILMEQVVVLVPLLLHLLQEINLFVKV